MSVSISSCGVTRSSNLRRMGVENVTEYGVAIAEAGG